MPPVHTGLRVQKYAYSSLSLSYDVNTEKLKAVVGNAHRGRVNSVQFVDRGRGYKIPKILRTSYVYSPIYQPLKVCGERAAQDKTHFTFKEGREVVCFLIIVREEGRHVFS